ncbi:MULTISPECIES: protein translocase subunit SecD [Treponema]|uniref:Protein translocase subunit SecD n=1 Tax=Treponema denticola (strain ATCC 35405 / DSM 14222 / CIP 103919 / JCM 8153 / KCTC 15104) TaxID=243275 RepID=Q73PW4_TREDE|nr:MULTISPECIES: protein translocase subunit SecD [Treponema]AAS11175.1 protein-export membrane protein SecD [Treponema denticola ATCC 35405]EMB34798.1 protein-export membrane protein SecD [Treponema denticola ATCC 35404]EMB35568.1 protein-export membrane protein SecD [Treponema denticola ATCC 33521]UTC88470.1 protein translocase subunit SecD [Treponema denticola]HCY94474.1 protein translocase subunit SecD [Treponema sp.]
MSKRFRFIVVLLVIALCFVFLHPTLKWYFWTNQEDKALALASREKIKDYSENMARADVDKLIEMAASNSTEPLSEKYAPIIKEAKNRRKALGMEIPYQWTAQDVAASFKLSSKEKFIPIAQSILETAYRDSILGIKNYQTNAVKLGLDLSGGMLVIIKADLDAAISADGASSDTIADSKKAAMTLAMDTLRSRIDKFGLTDPVIRRQGDDRIYIEMPGAADADKINSIIMGRGILAFHIVDDEATQAFREYYRNNPGKTFDADYNLLNPEIIPEDCMVLGVYHKDAYGIDERDDREPFLVVKKQAGLEGKHLVSVDTSTDQRSNNPLVNFSLDAEGAKIFAELTTNNVGKRLAIVSDNKIKSAPNLKEPITGGSGSISGMSATEANNLKTVLRTAWLNVPLQLETQQVVGASLGDEKINEGIKALQWGLIAVLVFMLVFYKEAGINACIAQILNLYIMFSILSAFNLTLTLPSIAGMILTIGMAVDANVVVFERIKEELRLGKTREASINAGFEHAFSAIMDSNITTFIAAFFLSILGTGPIKGFAYSLAIGVVSSVFTALFVSRLIFDFGTQTLKLEKIHISWRKL